MERKMRTCSCCREKYSFCPKCNEDKDKPLWYFAFCSSNCKDIYDITSKFENGQVSANDAKAKLDKLDLSNLDNFGESYKNTISKINSTADIVVNVEETVTEDVVETENVDVIVDIKSTETVETTEENKETVQEEKEIKKSKRAKTNVDVE